MAEQMIKHDPNEKLTQGWHLDKRISVAHFFATFAFATALASTIYGVSNRITMVEQSAAKHEALAALEFTGVNAQMRSLRERDVAFKLEIIRRLERIEDGIDRHIENSEHMRKQ